MKNKKVKISRSDSGFTLLNLLATMSLFSILALVAASNIQELRNPIAEASFEVSHYLRLARSRAISQTTTILVTPTGDSDLTASSAEDCNDESRTNLANLTLRLPAEANFELTDWEVCFTQRGLANESVTFRIRNSDGKSRTITVALGGGVQIQ